MHTHRFSAPVCTKIKANDKNDLISTWTIFYYVYLTSKVNKKKFDLFPLWYSNPLKNGIFSKMEPMLSRGVETTLLIKMSLFIMHIKDDSIEKVEKTGVFEVTFCDLRPRRARIDHVCTTNGSPCRCRS